MDKIVVEGGARLVGRIPISGAKNAALPLLAAALLPTGASTYKNVPQLADVRTMAKLLRMLGWTAEAHAGGAALSIARPIDQHLKGLQAMGAKVTLEHGYVDVEAKRLRGATIVLDMPTVTGCENLLMAAALAKGRSVIENAAREPEVEELALVLNKMGAKIQGAGTSIITIEGVDELQPIEHAIMPDRIEAGTFAVAAAITRGDVLLEGARPEHMDAIIAKLRAAGVTVSAEAGGLRVRGTGELKPLDIVTQ